MARRYRRRGYGTHKHRAWGKIIIIICFCIAILLIAFLIIGNILNNKIEEDKQNKKPSKTTQQVFEDDVKIKYTMRGYNIDLEDMTLSELSDQLRSYSENGINMLSLKLTDDYGYPVYNSSVAKGFGYGLQDDSGLSLTDIFAKIDSYEMVASVCVNITSNMEEDAKLRAVKAAYEAAIISEIAEVGGKDIVLCPSSFSGDDIGELSIVADDVKKINANTIIGVAVPPEVLTAENAEIAVDSLTQSFDFIAVDLSLTEGDDFLETIEFHISENIYYMLRYNARVLLPDVEEQKEALLDVLTRNNITNWQFIS